MTESIINSKNLLLQKASERLAINLDYLREYNETVAKISDLQKIQYEELSKPSLTLVLRGIRKVHSHVDMETLKDKLQKIGDAMVFGPIDWIVYKMQTKKFDTLQQFVDHCNGGDTICPLRFQFLEKSWIEKYRKPILESFDQSAFLADFVNSSQFMDLACDLDFDNRWWSSEGMVDQNGKTTKWGVAYKY